MEERQMNILQRLWGVIIEPVETFGVISRDPRVLIPALMFMGLNLVLFLLILPETQQFAAEMMTKTGQVSAEQAASMSKITAISGTVTALLGPPLLWLLQSVILLIFNQVSIGAATFKQLFAAAVYSTVPTMLNGALKSGLIKIIGMEGALKIKTSAALFMGPGSHTGFLYNFLAQLDFFTIWGLILLAIGGAVAMNKDIKKVAVYLFALWLIYAAGAAWITQAAMPQGMG